MKVSLTNKAWKSSLFVMWRDFINKRLLLYYLYYASDTLCMDCISK